MSETDLQHTSAFIILSGIFEMQKKIYDNAINVNELLTDTMSDIIALSTNIADLSGNSTSGITRLNTKLSNLSSYINSLRYVDDALSAYVNVDKVRELSTSIINMKDEYVNDDYYVEESGKVITNLNSHKDLKYLSFKTPIIANDDCYNLNIALKNDNGSKQIDNNFIAYNSTENMFVSEVTDFTKDYSNSIALYAMTPEEYNEYDTIHWMWKNNNDIIFENANRIDAMPNFADYSMSDKIEIEKIKINGHYIEDYLKKDALTAYVLTSEFDSLISAYAKIDDLSAYFKKDKLSTLATRNDISEFVPTSYLSTLILTGDVSKYINELKSNARDGDEYSTIDIDDELVKFKPPSSEYATTVNNTIEMSGKYIQYIDTTNITIHYEENTDELLVGIASTLFREVEMHLQYDTVIRNLTITFPENQSYVVDMPDIGIALPTGSSKAVAVFKIQTLYSPRDEKWVHYIRYSHRYGTN